VTENSHEANIVLTQEDLDLLCETLLKAYVHDKAMDNITYYELHGKLFKGYFQIARQEAARQIKEEERWRTRTLSSRRWSLRRHIGWFFLGGTSDQGN
jgi:hypothetical protein